MRTVLARPLATIRTLAVLAVLLVVVGAGIAWLIGRQLARPLVQLTGAVEAIAEGDYTERVDAGRRDEIGRLGVAFNRMAERVQIESDASAQAVDCHFYRSFTRPKLAGNFALRNAFSIPS